MSLPESPLKVFSNSVQEHGHVRVDLEMPWPLPWSLDALRTAIAWEVIASCEQWRQVVPRQTNEMLIVHTKREYGNNNYQWLDGAISKNAGRILACIKNDLSRVHPRPAVTIRGPRPSEEEQNALKDLGQFLDITIHHECKSLPDDSSTDARLAVRLLGSAGLVDEELGQVLIQAAHAAGDFGLETALVTFAGGKWIGARVFSMYEVTAQHDERLVPVFEILRHAGWPPHQADWQGLGIPSLLRNLWANPLQELDYIRIESTRHLKSSKNAFYVRINIARHFLRCFKGNGLSARLDLAEASVDLKNNRPLPAWNLLEPHLDKEYLHRTPILAAHIYGQAGLAAARIGDEHKALELYEKNLAYLEPAFGLRSPPYLKARAGLEHKLGQLIREHPELPGGLAKARQHMESSLDFHRRLGMTRGVSMCLSEMGEISLSEGSVEEARHWFEQALEADRAAQNTDGQARILHQLAVLHERNSDLNEALLCIEQCEHIQQMAGIGGLIRRQVLNTKKRIKHLIGIDDDTDDDFIHVPDATLADNPRAFATDVSHKARILRERGRHADAGKLLQKALTYSMPNVYRNFLLQAQVGLLLDLRRNDEARLLLKDISPTDEISKVEHKLLIARLELQDDNYEQAEAIFSELEADAKPEVLSRIHFFRGRMRMNQKRFAEAAVDFRMAREYNQGSPYAAAVAVDLEARANLFAGEYQTAVELGRSILDMTVIKRSGPLQIRAATIIGDALLHLGRASEAAQQYEYAIEKAKAAKESELISKVALTRRAARAHVIAGNSHAARMHIRNAIELLDEESSPPEHRGWVHHLAATIHRANGDLSEYEAALKIAEHYANVTNNEELRQAIVIVSYGDLRQDNWSMEEFEWEETTSPRAAIGHARRLRARMKLDEAVETLSVVENAQMSGLVRRELLELKIAIMLDMKEAGCNVNVRALLEQVVGEIPDSELTSKLLLLRARAELLERNREAAISTADSAYKQAQKYGEFFSIARAGVILSKALGELGRREKAVSILTQIAEYMQSQGRLQFAFDARYSVYRLLVDMRRFDEALVHLNILQADEPQLSLKDWVRLQVAYTTVERITGQTENALSRLNDIMERIHTENRPELGIDVAILRDAILVDRGEIRRISHRTKPAEHGKYNAAKSAAASIKALLQSGHHMEAIALAEQALREEGETDSMSRAIALHNAARAYFQGKKHKEAESLCRQSLDLHLKLEMPNGTPGTRVTLARIMAVTSRLEEAREQVRLALAENREARDHRGIGICERLLDELSDQMPSSGRLRNARDLLRQAQTLRRSGRAEEATKMVMEALKHARDEQDELAEAMALGALGMTSAKARDFVRAIPDLERAVELHCRLRSTHIGECSSYLARAYSELGQYDEARRVLERALESDLPHGGGNSDARGRLEQQLARLEAR